jgi:hypothetical protein
MKSNKGKSDNINYPYAILPNYACVNQSTNKKYKVIFLDGKPQFCLADLYDAIEGLLLLQFSS